jgi:hypothetical protein
MKSATLAAEEPVIMRTLGFAWKSIGAIASGAAWVFVLGTLFGLSWVIASLLGNPSDPAVMIGTEVDGKPWTAWGLSYRGTMGMVLAIVQGVAVAAAAVASALPADRATRVRRIGHVVLCAWAAMWTLNAFQVASLAPMLFTRGLSVLFSLLTVCTAYRAVAGWRPAPSQAIALA